MNIVCNYNFVFDTPEISNEELDMLPKMLYAEYKDRKDKRQIDREFQDCHSRLLAVEEGFLNEVFLSEQTNFTYKEVYNHWLDHWRVQVDYLAKKLKVIRINTRYFSDTYKPIEQLIEA
jgi:hypothetical protein